MERLGFMLIKLSQFCTFILFYFLISSKNVYQQLNISVETVKGLKISIYAQELFEWDIEWD